VQFDNTMVSEIEKRIVHVFSDLRAFMKKITGLMSLLLVSVPAICLASGHGLEALGFLPVFIFLLLLFIATIALNLFAISGFRPAATLGMFRAAIALNIVWHCIVFVTALDIYKRNQQYPDHGSYAEGSLVKPLLILAIMLGILIFDFVMVRRGKHKATGN
jgi:hypothetical protein